MDAVLYRSIKNQQYSTESVLKTANKDLACRHDPETNKYELKNS